jgi:hypothetical protein
VQLTPLSTHWAPTKKKKKKGYNLFRTPVLQKIENLSNYNSDHFDAGCRSMANSYQRNKYNFIYRNGYVTEVSKKIKDGKNKEST